jgi:hypothetical protein
MARSFKDIFRLGVGHFQEIHKEEKEVTIVEVVRMSNYFPSFVIDAKNQALLEEIVKRIFNSSFIVFIRIKV